MLVEAFTGRVCLREGTPFQLYGGVGCFMFEGGNHVDLFGGFVEGGLFFFGLFCGGGGAHQFWYFGVVVSSCCLPF